MKRFEEEGQKGHRKIKGGEKEKEKEMSKCRFFLTDQGCRRGKECGFSHEKMLELWGS